MNTIKLRNSHLFVGLFIINMGMALILEQFWAKIIGIMIGLCFFVYVKSKNWIESCVHSITEYFAKIYDILACIRFIQQDNVVETVKINTEIRLMKKALIEILSTNNQCAEKRSSRASRNVNNRKQKFNSMSVNNPRKFQSNISSVGDSPRVSNNCKVNVGYSNIKTFEISSLKPEHMMKFFKVCMEQSCHKVMLSNTPILTNLCENCKPSRGKSIDYYQFLTRANGSIEYFCGCLKCRSGNTSACLKTYCTLCTFPKVAKKTTH